MNIIGISTTTTTLRYFWAMPLSSLTLGVVIPCNVTAVKGEEVFFGVARIYRVLKRLWSKEEKVRLEIGNPVPWSGRKW